MLPRVLPLITAACLLVAGCASQSSQTESPIELSLEADEATLAPGEHLNLTVTVENVGEEPYRYQHPGCPPEPITAEVSGTEGPVQLYPYGQEPMFGACAVRNVTLEPGQQVTVTLNWNGRTQSAQPDPHTGQRLAAGTYTITAELARADGGPTFQHTVTVDLTG